MPFMQGRWIRKLVQKYLRGAPIKHSLDELYLRNRRLTKQITTLAATFA